LTVMNTLAYYGMLLIIGVQRFIILGSGACTVL
jgi:hypothetical protein